MYVVKGIYMCEVCVIVMVSVGYVRMCVSVCADDKTIITIFILYHLK